jgi:hypothetical protein
MQTEAQCPPNDRFLLADELLTDRAIQFIQAECVRRNRGKEVKAAYQHFMSWVRQGNQVALFTLYAYADLVVPKKYDCLFNYNDPAQFVRVAYELTHSIWEGWLPLDQVEHGHKHICVLTFPNQVPDIVRPLYQEDGDFTNQSFHKFKVGLCDFTDLDAITHALARRAHLKETYGTTWWEHEEEGLSPQ